MCIKDKKVRTNIFENFKIKTTINKDSLIVNILILCFINKLIRNNK